MLFYIKNKERNQRIKDSLLIILAKDAWKGIWKVDCLPKIKNIFVEGYIKCNRHEVESKEKGD